MNNLSLSNPPETLNHEYSTLIVGSGYGGAITAARLAEAGHSVCVFERGKEWQPGDFPDTLGELGGNFRRDARPLGLIDYQACKDIDVLKGNGLGGTSLINLSVAFKPDPELFDDPRWPKLYRDLADSGEIWEYYDRAKKMLRAGPHPEVEKRTKYQLMKKRAEELSDAKFCAADIAVHFGEDGPNHVGVEQKACIDCGDCFPGCNVGAKNTLMMNYLPYAKQKGAEIFTQMEVRYVRRHAGGGWEVFYRHNQEKELGEIKSLRAKRVVLTAGSLGSTEILLRSAAEGLSTSGQLGHHFSGNGDYLGLNYNGDHRSDVMGFGNHPESERAELRPGPTILSAIQYDRSKPFAERTTIEDFSLVPSALVGFYRHSLPILALTGKDTDEGDTGLELRQIWRDQVGWNPEGALNRSMVYLGMAIDESDGTMRLDDDGDLHIDWPGVRGDAVFDRLDAEMLAHSTTLGGTYLQLDRFNPWAEKGWGNLITAHPLGGCPLGEDADRGAVDEDGRVYDGEGGTHDGLFVVDGSILPMALAVNPLLTISALAERIAARIPELAAD